MPGGFQQTRHSGREKAFTLVEILAAMTVLILLIGLVVRLIDSAASLTNRSQGHMDTDGQARALLDRMAIDFNGMVKRPDVDYYLKGRPAANNQPGNDQIAFYSEVAGYFPGAAGVNVQSPASLVAYRVNSATLHLERLSKGLAWNGAPTPAASGAASGTGCPMFFLPVPLASPLPSPLPSPMPAPAPTPAWPQAASATANDLDYEQLGPQVFRFEYYYVLKGQDQTGSPSVLSITPWYAQSPVNHPSVNGLQDVAAIGVAIAVIDPKSRTLVSQSQLATLAGQMEDAPDPTQGAATFVSPGDLEAQWMKAVTGSSLPPGAASSIYIYTRCFSLNTLSP